MNFIRRVNCGFVALGLCLAMTAPSWGAVTPATWDDGGGDDFWSTGDNWDINAEPIKTGWAATTDPVNATIDSGFSAVLESPVSEISTLSVGGGATLTVNAGAVLTVTEQFTAAGWDTRGAVVVGNGDVGTVLQTGGTVTTVDRNFVIGAGPGAVGLYTLQDGTLTIGDKLNIGNGGTGTFIMQGGILTTTDSIKVGFDVEDDPNQVKGTGVFEIGGNSIVTAPKIGFGGKEGGTSTLRIVGANAEINIGELRMKDGDDMFLELVFGSGGISTINVEEDAKWSSSTKLDVTLGAGFELPGAQTDYDLIVAGEDLDGDTFSLVTIDGTNINSLLDWSIESVDDQIVRLSFVGTGIFPPDPVVPEPASIAIWSFLGICLAGYGYRRRRRNS